VAVPKPADQVTQLLLARENIPPPRSGSQPVTIDLTRAASPI
jgi:hypothetical protein